MYFASLVLFITTLFAALSSATPVDMEKRAAGPCQSFPLINMIQPSYPELTFLSSQSSISSSTSLHSLRHTAGKVISPAGGTSIYATQGYPTAKINFSYKPVNLSKNTDCAYYSCTAQTWYVSVALRDSKGTMTPVSSIHFSTLVHACSAELALKGFTGLTPPFSHYLYQYDVLSIVCTSLITTARLLPRWKRCKLKHPSYSRSTSQLLWQVQPSRQRIPELVWSDHQLPVRVSFLFLAAGHWNAQE